MLRDVMLLAQPTRKLVGVDQVAALARLAELRAQMLLARYRGGAVARLINTATSDEPSDLSRKAAVDLLKIDQSFVRGAAQTDPD